MFLSVIKGPNHYLGLFYFIILLVVTLILGYYFLLPFYQRISAESILEESLHNTIKYDDLNITVQLFDGSIESDFKKDKEDIRLIANLPVPNNDFEIDVILINNQENNNEDLYLGINQENKNILNDITLSEELGLSNLAPKTSDLLGKLFLEFEYIHIDTDDVSGEKIIDIKELINYFEIDSIFTAFAQSLNYASTDTMGNKSIVNFGISKAKLSEKLLNIDSQNTIIKNLVGVLDNPDLLVDKNIVIFVIDQDKREIESLTINFPTQYAKNVFENSVLDPFLDYNLKENFLAKIVEIDFININDNLRINKPEKIIESEVVRDVYAQEILPIFGTLIENLIIEFKLDYLFDAK